MAANKDRKTTIWNLADEASLVHTLLEQRNNGNWGDNNPKPIVWTACEAMLAGSENKSGGLPKTIPAIKSQ
jgi:hypothetical protein